MIIGDNLRRNNPYHEGRTMTMRHYELYEALGLNPKKHLPKTGVAPQYIGNVQVWVLPKMEGTNQDAKRVWCQCPHCHKVLTAGKFHQHMKVHGNG
jgi:hypothetical protein